MISFNLKCNNGHEFEAWFKDSQAFETQKEAGLLTCAICNSPHVEKGLSAPNISTGRQKELSQQELQRQFLQKAQQEISKIRREVEKNYENVGDKFATEARKIHYGEVEKKNIYGKATQEEVKELSEEGVEVAALPWRDDSLN